jgi:hypothetical protein
MKYCINCGGEIDDDAKFCRHCGNPVNNSEDTSAETKADELSKTVISKITGAIPASAQAGETALGDSFSLAGGLISSYKGETGKILSPARAIFNTIGSFFKGIAGLFKTPKNLVIILVLLAAWIVLWFLKDSDSQIVKISSFLTFANVGEGRSIIGAIGSAFGKGTVAAFWVALFSGGIPAMFRGIGGMFKKTGEKRSIGYLIIGAIVGAALYLAYAGIKTSTWGSAMAGIAGAVLAAVVLGRKSGPLYELIQAFSSKAENGVRKVRSGKVQSMFSGLSAGFVLATVITSLIN